ncbi:hypothetical protein GCM10009549_56780 [Streptomyces thermoalcalitolerans]|uniref:Uncharacterized protein n=1 Tax=Streptomyces thermoalcalitolerans TaxID=65605 RepID=A0ABN1PSJ6_9ACTN
MDEPAEGLLPADLLVEGLLLKRAAPNLIHGSMLSDAGTEDGRPRTGTGVPGRGRAAALPGTGGPCSGCA